MAKITHTFETAYDKGDVVIFEKDDLLQVGIIEGFYEDQDEIWYNIRTSKTNVYTFSNKGDIAEYDIIGKIEDDVKEKCIKMINIM